MTAQAGNKDCGGDKIVDQTHLGKTVAFFQSTCIQVPIEIGHLGSVIQYRPGDADTGIGRHLAARPEEHRKHIVKTGKIPVQKSLFFTGRTSGLL